MFCFTDLGNVKQSLSLLVERIGLANLSGHQLGSFLLRSALLLDLHLGDFGRLHVRVNILNIFGQALVRNLLVQRHILAITVGQAGSMHECHTKLGPLLFHNVAPNPCPLARTVAIKVWNISASSSEISKFSIKFWRISFTN